MTAKLGILALLEAKPGKADDSLHSCRPGVHWPSPSKAR
jgi:hypothetical protein